MPTFTLNSITYTYTSLSLNSAAVTGSTAGIVTANIESTISPGDGSTYNVKSMEGAFANKTTLTSVTIPSSVTSIGTYVFANCTGLTSVTIPNSVTSIGVNAFAGCSALPSITFPTNASFTLLSQQVISGCTSLTSITIPSSVTNISTSAISNCTGLTSITIPNSVTTIGTSAFSSCTNLTSITLPTNASFTTISATMFQNCSKLSSVTFPSSVTTIAADVFQSCTLLASIIFPDSVRTIGGGVFYNCRNLSSVTLPTNALFTNIGVASFQNCIKLTSLTIPNSVTTIQDYAYYGCTGLASLTIGNSVTSIGQQVFQGCTALSSVIIPSAVATIGDSAFAACSNLTRVYFLQPLTLPTLGTTAFSRNPPTSIGRYYSTVTNSSTITPFFTSTSSMTLPTLSFMAPFFSTAPHETAVISYANLVANGNESVDSGLTYVFLVNAVLSGSLSIGATQGSATPWNATTNKTIAAGTNAYWRPAQEGVSGLYNTFSVVIQDSLGALTSPNVDVQVNIPYPCFLEGSKILCFENNEEVYRPVESIQKGDLVKTIYNGYMPVCMIGTTKLYNPGNDYRVANRIYKCPREKYPTLFEDLYITGCHSILVPQMTNDQWENTKAVNGNIYVTDNHFRLIACADEKAEPFNKEGFMNIYHVALDHHDICMNYGIYANGLLVESCSIEYLVKYSNLKILGEEDSSVSEHVGNVSNNMMRQLVDTC